VANARNCLVVEFGWVSSLVWQSQQTSQSAPVVGPVI